MHGGGAGLRFRFTCGDVTGGVDVQGGLREGLIHFRIATCHIDVRTAGFKVLHVEMARAIQIHLAGGGDSIRRQRAAGMIVRVLRGDGAGRNISFHRVDGNLLGGLCGVHFRMSFAHADVRDVCREIFHMEVILARKLCTAGSFQRMSGELAAGVNREVLRAVRGGDGHIAAGLEGHIFLIGLCFLYSEAAFIHLHFRLIAGVELLDGNGGVVPIMDGDIISGFQGHILEDRPVFAGIVNVFGGLEHGIFDARSVCLLFRLLDAIVGDGHAALLRLEEGADDDAAVDEREPIGLGAAFCLIGAADEERRGGFAFGLAGGDGAFVSVIDRQLLGTFKGAGGNGAFVCKRGQAPVDVRSLRCGIAEEGHVHRIGFLGDAFFIGRVADLDLSRLLQRR